MSLYKLVLNKPVAFNAALVNITDSVTAALLLSQLGHYATISENDTDWIRKTHDQIQDQTGLSRREIDTARDQCVSKGFIEYKLKGVPPKMHFKICPEKINEAIIKAFNLAESAKLEPQFGGSSQINLALSAKSLIRTEISTENKTGISLLPTSQKDPTKKSGYRPSLEEMKAYGKEIALPISEAEACFDFYESNGWKVGRNPMVCWRAVMRTWHRKWVGYSRPTTSTNKTAVRISLETELKRVDSAISALREEMQYQWDRTPERCSRLKDLKSRKQQLEQAISQTIVIPKPLSVGTVAAA